MRSGVYAIKNLVNCKLYIGSTRCFNERKNEHFSLLRRGCHFNRHLQSAWVKYGESSFVFIELEMCDEQTMLERESCLILEHMATDRLHGYNNEEDPISRKKSEAHKAKISESLKIRYRTGYVHPNLGRKFSKEVGEKISKALAGRTVDPRIIERRSQTVSKPVVQFDLDGKLVGSFLSIKTAAEQTGVPGPSIVMCCKGKKKYVKGFVFRYKEMA